MLVSDIKFADELKKTQAFKKLWSESYGLVDWINQVHHEKVSDNALKWALAGEAIISDNNCDYPGLWISEIHEIIANHALFEDTRSMMTKEEYLLLQSLPEQIEVFRGHEEEYVRNGMSWTMEKEIAEYFASFHQGYETKTTVVQGEIQRLSILGLFLRKGEFEIYALPRKIKNKKEIPWNERKRNGTFVKFPKIKQPQYQL